MGPEEDDDEIFTIFHDNLDRLQRLTDAPGPDYLEQLVPIVRDQLQNTDSLDELISTLETISEDKSRQLESICKSLEDDILISASDILKIQSASERIQNEISAIAQELDGAGVQLIDTKKEYVSLKANATKITQLMDLITLSLQMLELSNKVHDLIMRENFFIALKSLDELRGIHLRNPDINQFKFLKQVQQSLPALTDLIKLRLFESVRKMLGNFDRSFMLIGQAVFEHTKLLIERWNRRVSAEKGELGEILKKFSLNSPIELTLRLGEGARLDPLDNEHVNIPLSPLYDAVLIYESILELDALRSRYLKEITLRKDRIFHLILKSGGFSDLQAVQEFLTKAAAFFVVDATINKSTRYKLRSQQATADLWDLVVDKLIPVLIQYINKTRNDQVNELVELKRMIGIFLKTMENYGFDIKKFYLEIVILLFKKYQKILLDNFEEEFKILLYEDDSMPMIINDITLYKKVLAVSWYQTDNPDIVPISPITPPTSGKDFERDFPKHLPFSQLYPMTCAQIRSFVNKLLSFLEPSIYNRDFKQLGQMLIGLLDELMSDKIGKHLKEKVNLTNREEIAQNLINLDFFYISSNEVSKLLTLYNAMVATSSSGGGGGNINLIKSLPQKNFRLRLVLVLKEIKKTAENMLFAMVDKKVLELVEMTEFDFGTTIANNNPLTYIEELGEFLKAMFSSTFSNLPAQVLALLIYRTFDILADNFKDVLKTSELITDVAILNFDSDLTYIENILNELGGDGSAEDTGKLRGKFEELRQIILLLRNGSFEEFRNFKSEKYNKVEYELGAELLNKLRINGRTISEIENQLSPSLGEQGDYGVKSPTSMGFSRFYKFRNASK